MKGFSEQDKTKCLLWCDRHCCLCGKACGTDIEIAHIDPRTKDKSWEIDNAIPLCYDCHAKTFRYTREHPRGNKYRSEELKARRNQIYDQYTQNLVPPVMFGPTQDILNDGKRIFPDVGFALSHLGDSHPIKVLVTARCYLGENDLGMPDPNYHYSGKIPWNLNPHFAISGHFSVQDEVVNSAETLKVEFAVTIIDQYDRQHALLPMRWVYLRNENAWFLEP